jgi:ribosomal protein S18 acetylase RimI-like enzyme
MTEGTHQIRVRLATAADWAELWPIWQETMAEGDSYPYPPDTSSEDARRSWLLPAPAETWLAEEAGHTRGSYLLRANQPGRGAHVANASFMVAKSDRGRGLGRLLAEHCLEQARRCGYLAMQFNAVVATNQQAIALWRALGFRIVGTVPDAFRHPQAGLVDLHVMHRRL